MLEALEAESTWRKWVIGNIRYHHENMYFIPTTSATVMM